MTDRRFKAIIISDFNADVFCGYLNNDEDSPFVDAAAASFGQGMSALIDKKSKLWSGNYDVAIVWTRPEAVIEPFNRVLCGENISFSNMFKEVEEYADSLSNLRDKIGIVFAPLWVIPTYYRDYGIFDIKNARNIEHLLMRMNLLMADKLEKIPGVHLLNTRSWVENTGKNAFNPKLWYLAKVMFANEVFKEATRDIKSALRGIMGESKKVIILDLDDTLWGGMVGEIGWQNINLGGHDPLGEAFQDFQKTLKILSRRGILLAIASKNEEKIAVEAIEKHPEMILRMKDFAAHKINWKDKAENIIELMSGLKLGLQSAVFIDNSPEERLRVREALPEVAVPEWPDDKMMYKKTLLTLQYFDVPYVSTEDTARSDIYATERKRQELKVGIVSVDEWLESLKIKITIEELNDNNIQRATQLLNKTNQMNLSTRRMPEKELSEWAGKAGNRLWTFRVSDKFGDSGITGIISLEAKNRTGRIADFVLSCRVIGRKIEEAMIYTVIQYARSIGLEEVHACFNPTEKNKPCLEFWQASGFDTGKERHIFEWKTDKKYPLPQCVKVEKGDNI